MAGNVREWTASVHAAKASEKRASEVMAHRGDSWASYDSSVVRAADRSWDAPGISSDDLGLRCVR